jgi:predicted RNA polymerase sigma factor
MSKSTRQYEKICHQACRSVPPWLSGSLSPRWGGVATLIGLIGDFDLAEESAQEAPAAAVDHWRVSGVPEFPRAWIPTARHKTIDRAAAVAMVDGPRPALTLVEALAATNDLANDHPLYAARADLLRPRQ